jgi:hypothetical protein
VLALAAVAASVVLQAGQVHWFLPGTLQVGQAVGCSIAGRVVSARVPTAGSDLWTWKGNASMSMSRATSGAVEVACNTQLAPPRRPTMPYVIGKNGVALIRGANRRSRLEKLYGRPTTAHASAGACTVAWRRAALQATFTTCAANAVLVRARAGSSRWSSITGVYVGDPLARVLFEAPYAKRLSATRWRLALSHGHSLVAALGAGGRVAQLVATIR